jgi:hypothetical protein
MSWYLRLTRTVSALLLVALGVALFAGACSKAAAPTPHASTPASSTPSLAPVADALWGTWEPTTPVSGTPPLTKNLVFSAHSWAAYDDDPTVGAIGRAWAVGPDQVVFGARGGCASEGIYTWKIDNGLLTLSGGAEDQCPRHSPLTTRVWKKVSTSTSPADTDITR